MIKVFISFSKLQESLHYGYIVVNILTYINAYKLINGDQLYATDAENLQIYITEQKAIENI